MRLEHLAYFSALETYGSINKVGQALHTTPQNVSRILKHLEDEMETDLFLRTPNGIIFTPSGKKLLTFTKSTQEQLDEIKLYIHLQKEQANINGEITLYSTNSANEMFLNDVIIKFQRTYPYISINNTIVDWLEGYQQIQQNPSILGILSYLEEVNAHPDLDIVQVYQGQVVLVMHKESPLAHQSRLTLEQLKHQKILALTKNNLEQTEIYHLLRPYIEKGEVKISTTGNLNAYYQLAATGQYICPASQEGFNKQYVPHRDQLVAIPFDTELGGSPYALVMNKQAEFTTVEEYFIDFVNQYFNLKG